MKFPIRGIMLDLARVIERPEYYRKVIDYSSQWGLNTILLHLTDDQGCALRFDSHPSLASPLAFSKPDMRDLARYAQQKGITLIPEVESFGHTRYITRNRKYAKLADGNPGNHFTAICPVHPETIALFDDVYRELAEVFENSPYIHIGCDEVDFGYSLPTQKALAKSPKHVIFGNYVARLVQIVRSHDKQPILWADQFVRDPRLCDFLDRGVVLHDWHYDHPVPKGQVFTLAKKGFKILAGPALMWCRYRFRTPREAWLVLDEYTKRLRQIPENQAMGVINTVWVPSRFPTGALWPALSAYAGRVNGKSLKTALSDFLCGFWGLNEKELVEGLIQSFVLNEPVNPATLFWSNPTELADAIFSSSKDAYAKERSLKRLISLFKRFRKKNRLNRLEYESFILSLKLQHHDLWRTRIIKLASSTISPKKKHIFLNQIHKADQIILGRMNIDWTLTRYLKDPQLKKGLPFRPIKDCLIPVLKNAFYCTKYGFMGHSLKGLNLR
jgi:hypothetical protein